MTACLAPACPSPKLGLGTFAFLCLDHALSMVAPTPAVRQLVDLRGRCWGDGLSCHMTAVTVTAHGGYCRAHAPIQPKPHVAEGPSEAEERECQLAVLSVMSGYPGATIDTAGPSLWGTRSYGDAEGSEVIPGRRYARTTVSRASTIPMADDRVPRTARGMARNAKGWSVRLRAVDEPPSLVLRAWRGPLLVVACWVGGSFESAWVQHSRGLPMRLQARQAATLLKAAP
jgi:hypothetical protein